MELLELLDKNKDKFRAALGAKRDFGGWWEITKTWAERTAGALPYKDVSAIQVVGAYEAAAKLGPMIDGEECMVMIRGKERRAQIKCEIGYKGVIRMAGQAGTIINARTIKQGDIIEIDEGLGTVKHTPAWLRGEKAGETLGYYAVATYRDGRRVVRAMSLEAVQRRARDTDAWKSWPDELGEKTVILSMKKVLYFGDELEAVISGVKGHLTYEGAEETGDEEPAGPQYPPQTLKEKVAIAASRAAQDADAEGVSDELPI